ncbi:hypothetical protein MLD38_032927 [Melastoma candidum]|uniref:Uncharacterized protein n=1 Tax=Melastoma candidum TaxID=119954 RepID=A0ACB9M7N6_9MYRT|nr:hypothetical protein MLD38_032927 [Melastoma candidum]
MYADRVEAEGKVSARDRLNGNSFAGDPSRRRQFTGKRQREDDKWEHDLFEKNNNRQLTSIRGDRQVGARDLRLKLQRRGLQPTSQGVKGSAPGVRDLREKLSGVVTSQPTRTEVTKPKVVPEATKRLRRTVGDGASTEETKAVSASAARKKPAQKADVDGFLRSLGLEKYSITFQAEEVDMTALLHMNDDDLKALGIPMGPRKKILLALESKE